MSKFRYDHASLSAIEGTLSRPRLSTYRKSAGADLQAAVDLYVWNTAVASALQGPLCAFEILLRNALNVQLIGLHGANWTTDPGFRRMAGTVAGPSRNPSKKKRPNLITAINDARRTVAERKRRNKGPAAAMSLTNDDTMASLNFGFWTMILDKVFEPDLWARGLWRAFPHYATLSGKVLARPQIAQRINEIRSLRNRVMHHEPLINRQLRDDYEKILEATSWISTDVADWIDYHSRFFAIFAERERPRHQF